ncbi:MAG TPA: response regulator [Bacteroidales bacterium]
MRRFLTRKKVLVVDDNEASRLLLSEILLEIGFTTIETAKGKRALELFETHACDIVLVLTDIKLPDISGYELITRLKKFDNEVAIIAISALPPHEAEIKCKEAGATHFLSKPFGIDEFEALVKFYKKQLIPVYDGN